ncbi:BlaI/MecI/CopY family transcriptional regulator [Pseudohongiella sp.]|uniref:CopY family transcriptional regulator n=1 Tax=marine sediment metagenome TaxID=412755 RepID=A0A0F9VZU2_9ZZZZ|nr:BlaI/MecI/CopY family transcriptional regulator [Pseudohongiella sp.]HDZ09783.1 BlaI/MecI/CopY family transcriptional regulator [Pseudohongiella sp.]HEA61603.1 BlaI/MecI/CopY family transcriptional regulator [Pseudohongiella sp.]
MTQADQLSRRERQIMDILYRLGQASAKDVMHNMDDAPGYSSVRTLLGKLVEKGHVDHRESGLKYVYFPLIAREKASRSALGNVVKTFFDDSPYLAVNSLLDMSINDLSDQELDKLKAMIQARKKTQNDKK